MAAYSTTRALYASYNGPLYQVMRLSDNAVKDIGVVQRHPFPGAGGYADAAAQDAFCANTTCVITKIYDQSPNHSPATRFAHSSNEPVQALGASVTLSSPLSHSHAINDPVRDAAATTVGYQGPPAPDHWFGGPALSASAGSMVLRDAWGNVADSLNYGEIVTHRPPRVTRALRERGRQAASRPHRYRPAPRRATSACPTAMTTTPTVAISWSPTTPRQEAPTRASRWTRVPLSRYRPPTTAPVRATGWPVDTSWQVAPPWAQPPSGTRRHH